jgi:hypothetical protein
MPKPLGALQRRGNDLAHNLISHNSKRLGLSRRNFILTASGAATTLLAFNEVHARAGSTGGSYAVPPEAALDPALADHVLGGDEFIFDIQGHHVNPIGKWRNRNSPWVHFLSHLPKAQCPTAASGNYEHLICLSQVNFIKDIFLDSDTQMAVLSFVPSLPEDEPLAIEDAARTQEIVAQLGIGKRLYLHGRVIPVVDADLARMAELRERWKISAWKTYTQFGKSWWLNDETTGLPFLEKVRASGLKLVCVHKGIPLDPQGGDNKEYSRAHDVGPAAKLFPDISFIVYHSGYDPDHPEGPYKPGSWGIDSLIDGLLAAGIKPGGNVYAELGSTWRHLMGQPQDQAAHAIGKLLKYVGEDNVVWGTDSIWYGSPQDQIQAFRAFEISEAFQEKYGYPALTKEIKAKIFGLNATKPYGISLEEARQRTANDELERARAAYEQPNPHFLTYGPKTRKEFLEFIRLGGHS